MVTTACLDTTVAGWPDPCWPVSTTPTRVPGRRPAGNWPALSDSPTSASPACSAEDTPIWPGASSDPGTSAVAAALPTTAVRWLAGIAIDPGTDAFSSPRSSAVITAPAATGRVTTSTGRRRSNPTWRPAKISAPSTTAARPASAIGADRFAPAAPAGTDGGPAPFVEGAGGRRRVEEAIRGSPIEPGC